MDSEWVVTVLVALSAAALIAFAIWVLNGPNRRRVADLERRLEESRRRSGLALPADRANDESGDDDATVIEFRPRANDRTVERLKHELAVVRDELLRWRAMSDDFERRWRAELETSEELRTELVEREATDAEVRRSVESLRGQLEQLIVEGVSVGDVEPSDGAEPSLEIEPSGDADPNDPAEPAVIDLRDRRSHLEERLERLEADLDSVRRDLAADDD